MRLVTRADFDGLACAAILAEVGIVDSLKFIHPKDLQDGSVEITDRDVLANVPYAEGCNMWFDHHSSEEERLGFSFTFEGESRAAPSCARIVYEYYGGIETMPQFETMIAATDKVDAGLLTQEEIIEPTGWVLLGFIMDPRTGFGRFKNFRMSNFDLMERLIQDCRTLPIEEILASPDIQERIQTYNEQTELFKTMILKHTRIDWEVIVTDIRGVSPIYTGNRFLIYSLFPDQNISVWISDGKDKENVSIAVGYSILNRTARVDVGGLMLKYGGGGHYRVGTCQISYEKADQIVAEIIDQIKAQNRRENLDDSEMSDLLDNLDDLLADL